MAQCSVKARATLPLPLPLRIMMVTMTRRGKGGRVAREVNLKAAIDTFRKSSPCYLGPYFPYSLLYHTTLQFSHRGIK
jgi:hypothetical protein